MSASIAKLGWRDDENERTQKTPEKINIVDADRDGTGTFAIDLTAKLSRFADGASCQVGKNVQVVQCWRERKSQNRENGGPHLLQCWCRLENQRDGLFDNVENDNG